MQTERHMTHRAIEPADPPFAKIVVGIEDDPATERAVLQAARLGSLSAADLDLLHVYEGSFPDASAAERAAINALLEASARWAGDAGASTTAHVLVGDAASLLEHEARERWSDLIAVGADAPGRLGKVATAVLRRAHCSVLVARPAVDDPVFPSRILCAVDGSEHSIEAVRQAAGIAAHAGRVSLRLLHVAPEANGGGRWIAAGDRALRTAVEAAARWHVEPTREIAVGDAPRAIVDIAGVWGADLVVVGSRGLRGLERLLLGSVGEAVARDAASSVLVARARPW